MRYVVSKPSPPRMRSSTRGWWGEDDGATADTVHVAEGPDMEDTGLLDAEGRRLYREREPFGFRPR